MVARAEEPDAMDSRSMSLPTGMGRSIIVG